jgi:uncharacterized protein with NAD-binding domain and iron-sulfur cluster
VAPRPIFVTAHPVHSVLVVGAGPAGLTAAYRLAQKGLHVTLIDQARAPGGNVLHEPGIPSLLLGCHHATWNLLQSLHPVMDRQQWQDTAMEFDLPGGRLVRYPRSRFPNPLHTVFTLGRFAGLPWTERWKLLSWLEAIWEGAAEIDKDLEYRTAHEWLSAIHQSEVARQCVWNPLALWLTGNALHKLSANALVEAIKPFLLQRPADSRIVVSKESWQTLLIEPIRERLSRHWTTMALNNPVVQMLYEGERVTGVRTGDRSVLHADWYVFAIPHHRLTTILPERWLSRYAYFQQIVDLTTGPCRFLRMTVRRFVPAPRLLLLSGKLFSWMHLRGGEGNESRVFLCATDAREHDGDAGTQATELLRSLGFVTNPREISSAATGDIPHAFLSLAPGTKARRPIQKSPIANLLLAGAWTDTGWPANLESAIVSGERSAEIITGQASAPD